MSFAGDQPGDLTIRKGESVRIVSKRLGPSSHHCLKDLHHVNEIHVGDYDALMEHYFVYSSNTMQQMGNAKYASAL